jgi:hypothetical protein
MEHMALKRLERLGKSMQLGGVCTAMVWWAGYRNSSGATG